MPDASPDRSAEVLAATVPDAAAVETRESNAVTAAEASADSAPVLSDDAVPVLSEERDVQATAVTNEAANDEAADEASDEAAAAVETSDAAAQPTRRHRVKVAALDAVEGKIAPRVERLRHASTVVLDEAADDPGLRFVLVAAVLILLSLGLLLLSQILD
jgi:hypothetical protein